MVTTEVELKKLRQLTGAVRPDYLQLHSVLNPKRIEEIAGILPIRTRIISLLSVEGSPEKLKNRAVDLARSPLKALLLDSKVEGQSGGTGKIHDWEISKGIREAVHPFPVILAGGLDPQNIGEAIRQVKPYAVDVATGVEEDGEKAEQKVERFLEEVKNSEA